MPDVHRRRVCAAAVGSNKSLQTLRDPCSVANARVMPVMLSLRFGYGVSLDAKHITLPGFPVESIL